MSWIGKVLRMCSLRFRRLWGFISGLLGQKGRYNRKVVMISITEMKLIIKMPKKEDKHNKVPNIKLPTISTKPRKTNYSKASSTVLKEKPNQNNNNKTNNPTSTLTKQKPNPNNPKITNSPKTSKTTHKILQPLKTPSQKTTPNTSTQYSNIIVG